MAENVMPLGAQMGVSSGFEMPEGVSNLANNKLLWQYLAAASNDIGSGKPIGANVNAVTQQNIAAQNYAKMLQKLLAGGGKVSMDKESVTIKHPVTAGNPLGEGGQAGTPGLATGDRGPAGENVPVPPSQTNPAPASNQALSLGALNPSASPLGDFSGSDLAGLTPQDISSALGLKLKVQDMENSSVTEAARNVLAQRKLEIEQAKLGQEKDTADVKNYQYAVAQGYKGSFMEFKNSAETTTVKDYEYAKSQGYTGSYEQWRTEIAKAGGTNINIGEKIGLKVEESKIVPRTMMNSGKLMEDIRKDEGSEAYQRTYFRLKADDPVAAKSFRVENRASRIQSMIDQGRGKQFDVKYNESTGIITFKVKWPNGDVEDYKYDLAN